MCDLPYKILVVHPEVPEEALDIMRSSAEVIVCESLPPNRAEILEKSKGVHGLFWATLLRLDAEVLDAAGPQLKSISTMSVGIDHIDVDLLKSRHLPLGHTPDVLNNAVADVAIGLMLSAARRFHESRQKIECNEWQEYHIQWMLGQEITGATVGFFGFGGIGQTIAKRLCGFEIERILYTTRRRVDECVEEELNASKADFDEMLSQSDIVFIAAPLTPQTKGVFNCCTFAKMKKTAILVNIARGEIINQDDLYEALNNCQIFAAGLDVMYPEPLPSDHKLLSLPNCVITPHFGSATLKTRTDMAVIAAHNVLRGLAGEPMFAPAY